jgi:hypothetical protein
MYLVTKGFGARIYNPGQLATLSKTPMSITADDAKEAFEALVEKANEIGVEEDWPLDRVAKGKVFVDAAADLALGVDTDEAQ